ncbi:DUF6410 domain-containing protein [Nonomuraea sediminis]|uniref:DUF6410 domain-containing protein n=1 Tax=Nonomuraea sediminis TaxID=2835864 RepID=UPI001BDC5DB9|nr:DUF6410 domain-containing protein [Nonomuraea sediminis]
MDEFIIGRDSGPAGRILRLLAGLAGLGLLARRLNGASLAQIALVAVFFLMLVVAYSVVWRLLADRVIGRISPWITSAVLLLPVLAYGTNPGGSAFFNGIAACMSISLIVNAVSGYGGVEVAAIPALVWRRRYPTYSPFNTADLLERALRERSEGVLPAVVAAVSAVICVAVFAGYWLVPLLSYIPAVAAVGKALPGMAACALLVPAAVFGYEAWRRKSRSQALAAATAALLTPAFVILSQRGGGPQGVLWGSIAIVGVVVGIVALVRMLLPRRPAAEQAEQATDPLPQ